MKIKEFDEFATGNSPENILAKLKEVIKSEDNTDCQNLKLFQSTRKHFDAMDQRKGTIYEKRLKELTQKWLAGEV